MAGPGEVRWNPETQSWDSGEPEAPYTPPPPPRPAVQPERPEPSQRPYGQPPPGPAFPAADPAADPADVTPNGPNGPHEPHASNGQPSWQPVLPEPAPPRPWFRRNAVIISVVVAVLAAGVGSYLLWGRATGTPPGLKPAPSAVESAPPSEPEPTPADPDPTATEPSPSAPPPGYRFAVEQEFSVAVPETWERRTEPGLNGVTVYFYEADGARRIQVFRVTEEGATPRGTLALAEKDLKGRLDGYQRNALGEVPDERGVAAELDYAYDSGEWDTRVRVLDRVIQASPDDPTTLYVVLTSGPAADWPEQREIQERVAASFTQE